MCPAATARRILWSIAGLALAMAPAQAVPIPDGLYGWTRFRDAEGEIDFVKIGLTGQATLLFSMVIPEGYETRDLTYDPTDGNFYGNLVPQQDEAFRIAQINPRTETLTHSVYTGLLRDGVEGIEYFKPEGLVVSGADATGEINALYVVTHSGVVLKTALLPAIQDQDHLAANSLGGDLHVLDTNHPTNGYSINRWTAPFRTSPAPVLECRFSWRGAPKRCRPCRSSSHFAAP